MALIASALMLCLPVTNMGSLPDVQIVIEDKRQMCVLQAARNASAPWLWWEFAAAYSQAGPWQKYLVASVDAHNRQMHCMQHLINCAYHQAMAEALKLEVLPKQVSLWLNPQIHLFHSHVVLFCVDNYAIAPFAATCTIQYSS